MLQIATLIPNHPCNALAVMLQIVTLIPNHPCDAQAVMLQIVLLMQTLIPNQLYHMLAVMLQVKPTNRFLMQKLMVELWPFEDCLHHVIEKFEHIMDFFITMTI